MSILIFEHLQMVLDIIYHKQNCFLEISYYSFQKAFPATSVVVRWIGSVLLCTTEQGLLWELRSKILDLLGDFLVCCLRTDLQVNPNVCRGLRFWFGGKFFDSKYLKKWWMVPLPICLTKCSHLGMFSFLSHGC
jgi:hypothetical protein